MGMRERIARWLVKSSSWELFQEIYGGKTSSSGVTVNAQTAMKVTTVLACVRVLAEGVSQVPLKVYKSAPNGDSAPDPKHPLYKLLHTKPNKWMTSFEFREMMMFHVLLTGNFFVFVNRVGSGRKIQELVPITSRVEVKQLDDGAIIYRVFGKEGQYKDFPQEAIWHVRGASWNGYTGLDIIDLAKDAIGLSVALEQNHSDLHKNGTAITGLLSMKDPLGKEQYEFLSAWLDRYAVGGDRHNKPMILDRGAAFTPTQMTGVDAQHLETRKHQIEEICRAFRVMPLMIGFSDKTATYASAEQMFLAHVTHSLLPWYERLQQSIDAQLIGDADYDKGYYSKFIPNALMRGAAKDRAEFFAKALGSGGAKGWLTQNEVRQLEDYPRSTEPDADALPQPAAPAEPMDDEPSEEGTE